MSRSSRRAAALKRRKEVAALVIERDATLCVVCGKMANDIHEIIPRSRFCGGSIKAFTLSNMCCICRGCHDWGQTVNARIVLQAIMAQSFGYDAPFFISDNEWLVEHRHMGLKFLADNKELFLMES